MRKRYLTYVLLVVLLIVLGQTIALADENDKLDGVGSAYQVEDGGTDSSEPIVVTFDFTGGVGDFPTKLVADQDGKVTFPVTNLSKSGHIFYRWDTKPTGDGTYYFDDYTYTFTESTTLYAIWLEGYQITYNLNGGQFADYSDPISYYLADHHYWLPSAEREGYSFHGWYFDPDCSYGSVTQIQESFRGDLVLYARWEPVGAAPYLMLYANDGTGRYQKFEYLNNELVDVPAVFERPGYVLWQWNTMPDGSGYGNAPGFSIMNGFGSYYAQWAVPYKITYVLNGGTNNGGNPSTFYKNQVVLKDPTRKGYIFDGWYLYSNFSGSSQWQISSYTNRNVTLYAKWTRDETQETEECKHDYQCTFRVEPNCVSTGKYYYTCSICEDTYSETLPKTDHEWDDGVITTEPTAQAPGVKTFTCKNCGENKEENVPYTPSQDPTPTPTPDPTPTPTSLEPGKTIRDKTTNGVYKVNKDGKTLQYLKPIVVNTSVVIPDTITAEGVVCKVTSIGAKAFLSNATLKTVVIGANVKVIYDHAFYGCSALTKVTGGARLVKLCTASFANCPVLVSFCTLPKSLNTIEAQAFYKCSRLVKISGGSGVTAIGSKAFYGCKKLASIGIGAEVTKIGTGTFYGCTSLSKITIPLKVKTIGAQAFYKCTGLTTVKGAAGVTTIGTSAFSGCKKLAVMPLGKNLTTIGKAAFANCTALPAIVIPAKVKSIGKQAFYKCSALKTIKIKTKLLTSSNVGAKAFTGIYAKAYITVPKSVLSKYKTLLKAKGVGSGAKIA